MKTKTHEKLNISIPIDLHVFLLKKQKSEQQINPLATIPLSRIVATAIREYKENDEGKDQTAAKGQTERGAGANALLPSESSVTLRSTATKTNIRRAG